MSAVAIPFGANGVAVPERPAPWAIDAEFGFIATHYGIRKNTLRFATARKGGLVGPARDALAWLLIEVRQFSQGRAAQFMNVSAKAAREAAARHAHRIQSFNARFTPVEVAAE